MSTRQNLIRSAKGPTIPIAIQELSELEGTSLTFLSRNSERRVCSYSEVYKEMMQGGQNLLNQGLVKGDAVAIILPESDDFILSFLGVMAAGLIPVPMFPPLSLGKLDSYVDTAARILDTSNAKALITDSKIKSILWSLVDRVDTLESVIDVKSLDKLVSKFTFSLDDISLEDTAFLQFTSGSTSTPKGVVVSYGNLAANLVGIMEINLQVDENDVAVSWLPLYHDMGLIGFVLAPVWYGVPAVYIPPLDFLKQPSRWMKAMNDYRGTYTSAPNFAFALAKRRTKPEKMEGWDLSHIKLLGCGAEPNHPATLQAFLDHFAPVDLKSNAIMPVYGMAEATVAISGPHLSESMKVDYVDADIYQAERRAEASQDGANRLEFVSCGRTFPDHRLSIIDEERNELPDRHVGQIVFEGPSVAAGYYQEPEKTKATFTDQGLLTGDLGYIADGEIYITGRMKDIIILNGRNYDPQSIEWIVQEIDGVRKGNVVAFSVPSEHSEVLVVVAEVKDDIVPEELIKTIQRIVKEELFLLPEQVLLIGKGQLPKTTSGKVQRSKTREQFLNNKLGHEGIRTFEEKGNRITLAKHVAKSTLSQVKHKIKNRVKHRVTRTASKIFSRD